MPAQDNAAIVRSLFDAINHYHLDRAASLVDPDVEWIEIATGRAVKGRDAFRQLLQGWLSAFPDNNLEITNLVPSEHGAAVEYISRGTHAGPLNLASARFLPTGRYMEVAFCDVYHIADGKIVRAHAYFDVDTLLRQLGLQPLARQAGA